MFGKAGSMRSGDDKSKIIGHASAQESSNVVVSPTFEIYNGQLQAPPPDKPRRHKKVVIARNKPTSSKWDDAQKWIVGLSGGGDRNRGKNAPRNSNADDRRLLNSASQNGRSSYSSVDGLFEYNFAAAGAGNQDEGETKKIDCGDSRWNKDNPVHDSPVAMRSVCLRDMGTEMTPIASKEPSRTGTPLKATTPALRSPISSRSSTPSRRHQEAPTHDSSHVKIFDRSDKKNDIGWPGAVESDIVAVSIAECKVADDVGNVNSLECRAMSWYEAERAKNTARYKREEVKIQAWENDEKRKSETEMKRIEAKAEKMKAKAQEKLANKLAASRRMAEEKRASAEAKLNERAARTTEKADYIRRTGHLPSSFFSFKLPSLCG